MDVALNSERPEPMLPADLSPAERDAWEEFITAIVRRQIKGQGLTPELVDNLRAKITGKPYADVPQITLGEQMLAMKEDILRRL